MRSWVYKDSAEDQKITFVVVKDKDGEPKLKNLNPAFDSNYLMPMNLKLEGEEFRTNFEIYIPEEEK